VINLASTAELYIQIFKQLRIPGNCPKSISELENQVSLVLKPAKTPDVIDGTELTISDFICFYWSCIDLYLKGHPSCQNCKAVSTGGKYQL